MGIEFICITCGTTEDQETIKGYTKFCVPCACEKMGEEIEQKWNAELIIYKQRTNKELDFNEFFNECLAGRVKLNDLKNLIELTQCYTDAQIYLQETIWTPQLQLDFNDSDLPF